MPPQTAQHLLPGQEEQGSVGLRAPLLGDRPSNSGAAGQRKGQLRVLAPAQLLPCEPKGLPGEDQGHPCAVTSTAFPELRAEGLLTLGWPEACWPRNALCWAPCRGHYQLFHGARFQRQDRAALGPYGCCHSQGLRRALRPGPPVLFHGACGSSPGHLSSWPYFLPGLLAFYIVPLYPVSVLLLLLFQLSSDSLSSG